MQGGIRIQLSCPEHALQMVLGSQVGQEESLLVKSGFFIDTAWLSLQQHIKIMDLTVVVKRLLVSLGDQSQIAVFSDILKV